jgi:high-affinity Fe2+/Pb2+ permease
MSQEARNPQNEPANEAESPTNPANSKEDVQGMKPSGEGHGLAITPIIGATMGAIGVILLLQGLFGTTADYRLSNGININIWWGLVLIIFGILMWGGNFLATRRQRA